MQDDSNQGLFLGDGFSGTLHGINYQRLHLQRLAPLM